MISIFGLIAAILPLWEGCFRAGYELLIQEAWRYEIVTDMVMPADQLPHGNERKDYAAFPRVNLGTSPPVGWSAIRLTGMIYRASNQPSEVLKNFRIQIRHYKLWGRINNSTHWTRLSRGDRIDGAYFPEDFSPKPSLPALIRPERDGGVSVSLIDGYNFHFWTPRTQLPGHIKDVIATWEARLIPVSKTGFAERSFPVVGAASADYWRSVTAPALPGLVNNDDVAIGRFKYVTPYWRSFNMATSTRLIRLPVY